MASTKSTITVGLVTIPVRLEKATDDENTDTHTICAGSEDTPHDPTRVKMSVRCPSCETERSSVFAFPKRGHEVDGKMVVISADELAQASGEPIKAMVPAFHPREKVYAATVASDSVQNVTPDRGGEKGYAALRHALTTHPDLVAVAIWAPKSKNALWVLEVVGDRIVASKRAWPESVRVAPAIPHADVSEVEQQMFAQLVESMVTDFDLLAYVDERKVGVQALIEKRLGSAVTLAEGAAPTVSAGGDMLAALQASINAAQPKKPVAKKAAARVPQQRKAPAKKAAAKKPTPRKKVA